MTGWRSLASFWLLALLAAPALADPTLAPLTLPAFTETEQAELASGGTVVRDLPARHEDGIRVLVASVVPHAPEVVWPVMADCEEQDEYLPRISHASVRDREGDAHTCDLVIDLPFPVDDTRAATRHRVRRLPDGGYQRVWHLLPGDWSYHRHDGSWTVHPWGDGQSLLVNRMDLHPKTMIPLWVIRAAQKQQAPESFEAIRQRVDESVADASGH